jgi:hypothetical protein
VKVNKTPGPARRVILGAAVDLGQRTGRVGWFPSAKYEDGTPVAGVAAVQELGSASQGIPPRPFFRPTGDEKSKEWAATAKGLSRAVMRGQLAPANLFEQLCLSAEGDVRATITKLQTPALAPETIAARKRKLTKGKAPKSTIEKPLVDSGYLLATLTSQVE